MGYVISPDCSEFPGFSFQLDMPRGKERNVSRKNPNQMPEASQVASFGTKEQQSYNELSKGEPRHPVMKFWPLEFAIPFFLSSHKGREES